MFYDRFKQLCERKGISCNKAAQEIGLSNATPTKWKKTGATPVGDTLDKIAVYFGVSVDYLLGKEKTTMISLFEGVGGRLSEAPDITLDDELNEYLEELKNREELRMLFSLTKGATKEEVERAVRILEAALGK